MKKTLVSALTTALVVGAASTTFAAANPFSDVPADHWAYDAISQLAADGVIDGYGDGTYRGDRNITRYEMAQLVARAMAKNDVSAATKAMIDKLAAEFADELNSLGVRVANLEKNADMVKWNGKLEYTYQHYTDKIDGQKYKSTKDVATFRLEPSAEVNDHWHVNARIDGTYNLKEDNDGPVSTSNDADFRLKRAWAQGDYKNFSVRFGKFSMYGDSDINDTTMTGADVFIGNKNKVSGSIGAGRSNGVYGALRDAEGNYIIQGGYRPVGNELTANPSNVFYAGVDYNLNENKGFNGGLRFFRYSNTSWGSDDKSNVWQVRLGYKFDRSSMLKGFYAHANKDNGVSGQKKSYSIEYDYKGAQAANKGTWGAWLAYRHLGANATPAGTWDVNHAGYKGWEIGANYTFMKNIIGTLRYGHNKGISTLGSIKSNEFFGRVEWLF